MKRLTSPWGAVRVMARTASPAGLLATDDRGATGSPAAGDRGADATEPYATLAATPGEPSSAATDGIAGLARGTGQSPLFFETNLSGVPSCGGPSNYGPSPDAPGTIESIFR